ncbi:MULTISPECIES: Stp1/IreP family PP2C-type Ser/Thr phosphatase [Pelosinus]|uniref:Protein phosphatase 2C domain protein n=1 Tax=Pelosinus fermentans B4 TaxID=1149862 RepID=I9LCD7_9FIRM|nr:MULTISPECIES: Stp1/IreP family PP2C-type Ser/Thr phosphatase [Pelosinus]EIW18094.1 protein phosphatase 2C domain protein [Pelosinus fermentans B4]EIW24132.1 protein serine/threonine phosphatase [Pelosinus fermentans A11]OAM94173.1 protein serine/threonine phosphatase [Pelosinus fermentans DSM 17108]SDR02082.1 Serine/threonine protein phosphatase PrpC [Pelosinus fermentans]
MLAHVISDIGLVRETNEDSYICDPPHLFIVADGMGGHVAGEIASKLAISTVNAYIQEHVGKDNLEILLKDAIIQANTSIYQMALSKEEFSGMGTTVTASYIDGDIIYWGHVGDSRMYLLRNGKLNQLTNDHSLVWELVQSGNITRDEAYVHPKRNLLTRAVGTSCLITVDTGFVQWKPGDIVLMCTDGLTNMVSEQNICTLMQRTDCEISSIVEQLVNQAKDAGGFDNITVILLKNEDI